MVFGSAHDEAEWVPRGFEHEDGLEEDGVEEDGRDDLPAQPPMIHDGIPITGWYRGEPIPDLNALPQDRWLEVLRPLSHWPRVHATAGLRTVEQAQQGLMIKGQLLIEDGRPAALEGPPPRMPSGAPPARGASRQVNFRMGPQEHARLVEAARLFAMRPTALARTLTIRGVDRALYEQRRDR